MTLLLDTHTFMWFCQGDLPAFRDTVTPSRMVGGFGDAWRNL
jgi:PIN domain nuclease of toxin-antitoxin system